MLTCTFNCSTYIQIQLLCTCWYVIHIWMLNSVFKYKIFISMYPKALRCCLAPEDAVEANLLCKHMNDTIQGRQGGGCGEGRSETNTRWYVPRLATASQNHTASCLITVESPERLHIWRLGNWYSPGLGGKGNHLFVGSFLFLVSPWSNFTQWDIKTSLPFQVV